MECLPKNNLITLNGNFYIEIISFNKKTDPNNPDFLRWQLVLIRTYILIQKLQCWSHNQGVYYNNHGNSNGHSQIQIL
jgi:hypothetical protein